MWGKPGVCSEPCTSVLTAELRALAEILCVTCGPLTIHVDNAQVVDGDLLGREWCLDTKREGADIWREVWAMLSEVSDVKIVKMNSHLGCNDVVEGRIPFEHWVGNGVADA